jgi:hypothetical protein
MKETFIKILTVNNNDAYIRTSSIVAVTNDGFKTSIFVKGDSESFKTYEDVEDVMNKIW